MIIYSKYNTLLMSKYVVYMIIFILIDFLDNHTTLIEIGDHYFYDSFFPQSNNSCKY